MTAEAGFGVVPLEQARTMDGLTLFKGLMEGRFPAPPIGKALGMTLAEVEFGRVVFAYTPVFDHYNPLGSVHGGIAATLLDSVMGCCIHTTLKAGTGYTTVEIKVNYVRAMTDRTGAGRRQGHQCRLAHRHLRGQAGRRLRQAAGAWHHDLPDLSDLARRPATAFGIVLNCVCAPIDAARRSAPVERRLHRRSEMAVDWFDLLDG